MSDVVKRFLLSLLKPGEEPGAVDPTAPSVPGSGGDDMNTTTATAEDTFYANEEQLAMLEKDFDRAPVSGTMLAVLDPASVSTLPAPPDEPALPAVPPPAPAPEPVPADFKMPPSSYMHKGIRHQLLLDGVCVDCARCGMKLTDSVSIERGLGPDCSSKGYAEDPVNSDEMQAFIDLAEYPALCEYLTAKYKPLGVRGLMNGLVKVAALNRRAPGLHSSICDAIESLGYRALAASLRDSIAVIEIKESKRDPECYSVWVKKSEWTYQWQNDLKSLCGMSRYERFRPGDNKGILVPKKAKRGLWEAMLQHYGGFVAKTPKGTIKIERKTVDAGKSDSTPPPAK